MSRYPRPMTMSIWVFLLIVGLALLTGHGMRAKAASLAFFLIGILIGGSYTGQVINDTVNHVVGMFS